MKKFVKVITAAILVISVILIFASCNKNDVKTNPSTTTTTNISTTFAETVSANKFNRFKNLVKQDDFVSAEAEEIYNLIISSNTVSGSTYEKICEFLVSSPSSLDELDPCSRIFKLTSNCTFEINNRVLWLVVNNESEIERERVLSNIDVFNIGEKKLTMLDNYSIYDGTIYQYGKSFGNLYDSDYVLLNTNNPEHPVLRYSNVLTCLHAETENNGKLCKVSEKTITEDCINDFRIFNIDATGAGTYINSLFYQTKNKNIYQMNLFTGETKLVSSDEDYVLVSDASGVYWVNIQEAQNFKLYNIPSSTPGSENFVKTPQTIINWSGEEVNFSFDELI